MLQRSDADLSSTRLAEDRTEKTSRQLRRFADHADAGARCLVRLDRQLDDQRRCAVERREMWAERRADLFSRYVFIQPSSTDAIAASGDGDLIAVIRFLVRGLIVMRSP